jgi:hypothetical protein
MYRNILHILVLSINWNGPPISSYMFTYILINCPVPHVSPNCSAYTVRYGSFQNIHRTRSFFIPVFSLHIQSSSCKKVLFHSPSPYISLLHSPLHAKSPVPQSFSVYIFLHSPLHAKSPVPQSFSVYIFLHSPLHAKKSCSTVLFCIYCIFLHRTLHAKKSCSTVLLHIYLSYIVLIVTV